MTLNLNISNERGLPSPGAIRQHCDNEALVLTNRNILLLHVPCLIFTVILFVLLLISQISYLLLTNPLRKVLDNKDVEDQVKISFELKNSNKKNFNFFEKDTYHG